MKAVSAENSEEQSKKLLDAKVRKELSKWLRALHEKIRVTAIFVTHDQEEALDVAN